MSFQYQHRYQPKAITTIQSNQNHAQVILFYHVETKDLDLKIFSFHHGNDLYYHR